MHPEDPETVTGAVASLVSDSMKPLREFELRAITTRTGRTVRDDIAVSYPPGPVGITFGTDDRMRIRLDVPLYALLG